MTYDYIIIGGGSAGSVIANRLSANEGCNVLLLEAGGSHDHWKVNIPGMYGLLYKSQFDWAFETEPQKHVLNRKIFIPRGKALGGSSSTNAMAYVRGHRADFDRWAAAGNPGWDYDTVLPFFLRSENNADFSNRYHGKSGELHVTQIQDQPMLCDRFLSACKDAGISYLEDYNQEETEGASLLQFTIKNGIRQSTAKAFLEPVRQRPNLQVKTGVTVDRIILEKNKAVGVSVCNSKVNAEVFYCHAEVILCAGAIHSPVILQRSGIGPEAALKQCGVSVLNKLDGVGANLQDHLWTGISMFTNIPTANALRSPLGLLKSIFQYATNKTGILSNGPLGANAFLRTSAELDRPDIQIHLAKMAIKTDYQTDPYDIQTFPGTSGLGLISILLHPLSRGFVHLRSTDPRANPIIQPNFLSEPKDLEILKCGLEKVIEIALQEPLKQICPDGPHIPKLPLDNDQMTQHILRSVETLFHPVGTCKMGTDDLAVVDATLRVHGIKGLRVADASIMPEITSGNTNAPTIMIAERAAEWILAY